MLELILRLGMKALGRVGGAHVVALYLINRHPCILFLSCLSRLDVRILVYTSRYENKAEANVSLVSTVAPSVIVLTEFHDVDAQTFTPISIQPTQHVCVRQIQ